MAPRPRLIRSRSWLLAILVVSVCLVLAINLMVRRGYESALQHYRAQSASDARAAANNVETTLNYAYQGLRTISLLNGVRNVDRHARNLSLDTRSLIRELYKNLRTNVDVSEIYVVPADLDPDKIDPVTRKGQEPIIMFDDLIAGAQAQANEVGALSGARPVKLEEVEIYEYRALRDQMAWLKAHAPRVFDVNDLNRPMVSSPEVITCDNTVYAYTGLDKDRSGIVLSTPFYGPDGRLRGAVSAIIRTEALASYLPDHDYALVNPVHGFQAASNQGVTDRASLTWLARNQPDPSKFYSALTPVNVPDAQGRWEVWVARPNAEFLASKELRDIHAFQLAAYAVVAMLTVAAVTILLIVVDRFRVQREGDERLNLALNAAGAALFETNYAKRAFWCSPQFVGLIGRRLTFEQATNGAALPMCHPEDAEHSSRTFIESSQSAAEHSKMEARVVLPSGDARWIDWRTLLHRDASGRVEKIVGLALDIDAHKHQQQALIVAQKEAQAGAEAKAEFLANMSHEIRTPMNGVMGVLQLLAKEDLSTEGRGLLDEAALCGRMLSQLLNDVMDFSKIEAGRLELSPEPINVIDSLEGVVRLLRPQAEAKGLRLDVRTSVTDGWVQVDPVRLRQALFNLIGNAVKFTATGGVEVRVSVAEDEDGRRRVRFEVEDTGIGIPVEAQASLFQRFRQGDGSTSRHYGGTGLGLVITRSLAELMGGEVGFFSHPGKGSTFWLSFAAEAAEQPAAADDRPAGVSLDGRRVLVVDDNFTNRLIASKIMEGMGAEVETAEDGRAGLEAATTGDFDLILMDVQMPGMDGVEATRLIRRLPGAAADTPILGLTANVMSHQLASYLRAGMNGVVAKPISMVDLMSEICRVLDTEDAPATALG